MNTRILLSTLFTVFIIILFFHGCKKEEEIPPDLPTVTTSAITDITTFSAQGGGHVTDDGGAAVTARGVVWGLTQNPVLEEPHGMTVDGQGLGAYASQVTDLLPGTVYHVRAYATNSVGTAYGDHVSFTTNSETASVTTADITEITSFSAISGGFVADDGGAEVTERGIVWGASQNPDVEEYEGKTTDGSGTGSFTSEMSELNRGTTYFVRAYATNQEGVAYGNELSFTTMAEPPSVTTLDEVAEVTSSSGISGGQVTDDGGSEVTAKGIVWSTMEDPTVHQNEGITDEGPGTGSFTSDMTDLMPLTTYYLKAYATNSEGTTYGEMVSFITLSAVTMPTVLTNPVTNITDRSATAGGHVTESGGANVTERGIAYATSPDPTTDDLVVTARRGTGTFIALLTGLDSQTTYYVRAYATNSAGTAYGEEYEFTTERYAGEPCPGAPSVTDHDGNVYKTVAIGNQCWMKENLKTTSYNDGAPIAHVPHDEEWIELNTGAFVWPENDENNKMAYGAQYNWHAVNTEKLCPPGWRVPTIDDWNQLSDYLIDQYDDVTSDNLGEKLKSCRQVNAPSGAGCDTTEDPRWDEDESHHGTDDFGFSAMPGGSRNGVIGYFHGLRFVGYWWSSSEFDRETSHHVRLYNYENTLTQYPYSKRNGYSVRCVRNK